MSNLFNGLVIPAAVVLLTSSARADVPSFNKRGSGDKEEKAFVEKVAQTIVKEARTSAKDITLQKYKFKEPKEGHKELTIEAGYKGVATKTQYNAEIVVHLDTSTKDKWEVLSIEYKDDNDSLIKFSQKNVDALVNKFNAVK
jgi:hypothetical protein